MTTNYTLDLAAGLTQVLDDETNAYLYGNGRIAQAGSTTEYFLGDALGSVRQLTDTAGAVTLTQSYTPYGETVSSVGSGYSAYQYTGEVRDANGLIYLRARYYASSTGRFVSKDTWDGDYNRPLSLNPWNYVEGNPVNFVDPSGHYAVSSTGHNAMPVQASAQAQIYSALAKTGSQDVLSVLGCSVTYDQNYVGVIDFGALAEALRADYMLGWDNFISAWSILKHPDASLSQKAGAYAYMATWGTAHGLLGLGAGLLTCVAIGPSCTAIVNSLLGIGTAASADGDPTNEILAINHGSNVVYRYVENGLTKYIGITNNFNRRAAEHLAQRGWVIERIPGLSRLNRFAARAVEQVLIERYGLSNLYNKINSIASSNPTYKGAITLGTKILEAVGFLK